MREFRIRGKVVSKIVSSESLHESFIEMKSVFSTGWSSWSACSKKCDIGSRSRSRTITTHPAHGGARCPTLSGGDGCGQVNGGCGDRCIENDGRCICISNPGYEIQGNDDISMYCFIVES